jgi:diacylglycerol kinase family enzyme
MEPIGASTSRDFEEKLPEIVLVNPKAGSGAASRITSKWKPLLTPHHKVLIGNSPQETESLAAQAAANQVPRLIIIGGDGTLHHALNGYLSIPKTTTQIAIVPSGTANDYAASLRQHAQSKKSHILEVDVGLIRYGNFQRFFLNVAGIGLTAHAAISSRPSPWLPARLRYTLGLMRSLLYGWRHVDTSIQIEDHEVIERHLLTLSVAIGSREGSFPMAPDARIDDGYFNLLIASNLRRRDVCRYLPGLMLGKLPRHDSRIEYRVAKELRLSSSVPLYLHLDGEIYGDGLLPANCDIRLEQSRKIVVELLKTH